MYPISVWMRLGPDLITEADQVVNPVNDRTLVLRGNKIAVIENLGVTRDQYACIDLCDNGIIKVSGIPKLCRLHSLLLANNRISRIAQDAFDSLPELKSLVLSNNKIAKLATLLPIANLNKLERLSLADNPVTREPHYRFFLIHLLRYAATFRYIDFQRITVAERQQAQLFFESDEGRALLRMIVPEVLGPEEPVPEGPAPVIKYALSQDVLSKIKLALTEAEDMDVVNKLERSLKTGEISDEVAELIGIK